MVFGTESIPLAKKTLPTKSEAQLQCEANGGKWDDEAKVCIMPETDFPTPEETERQQSLTPAEQLKEELMKPEEEIKDFRGIEDVRPQPPILTTPETFTDVGTGEASGVTLPDGRTFFGLNKEEIEEVVRLQTRGQGQPAGTAPFGAAQAQAERQRLSAQLGQLDQNLFADASAGDVSYVSALASAVPGIIPDVIGGVVAGAGIGGTAGALGGTAVVPGVGTVTGATGGAVAGGVLGGIANGVRGFYSDVVADIKRQKGDYITSSITGLQEHKGALSDIISATNANPALASDNQRLFNIQLSLIERDRQQLIAESNSDLNKFLGHNTIDEIGEYEDFYSEGGEREIFIQEMFLAVRNPDPSRIIVTGNQEEDLRKVIQNSLRTIN